MRRIAIIFLYFLFGYLANAQDKSVQEMRSEASRAIKKDPNDTIPKIWKTGGLLRLTFTQGAQDNWAAGGENSSLALSSFFNGFAFYKKGKNSWENAP